MRASKGDMLGSSAGFDVSSEAPAFAPNKTATAQMMAGPRLRTDMINARHPAHAPHPLSYSSGPWS
jgi:hypothetical protein